MSSINHYKISKINAALFICAALILFSCITDINEVNRVTNEKVLPVEEIENVEMWHSKNALLEVYLKSPLLLRFDTENPYTEFPKGINVLFYDSLKNIKSEISADYAISYKKTNIIEGKGNVVVINSEGKKLETDHLIWDEKINKIYTESKITITTPTEIIKGESFEADAAFTDYKILKTTGIFDIENE